MAAASTPPAPAVGSTTYTYQIAHLRELEQLMKANRNRVAAALSVFVASHPCSMDELFNLWGYKADQIAAGATADSMLLETRL